MSPDETWNKSMYFFDISKEKKYRNITKNSKVLAGITDVSLVVGDNTHLAELPKNLSQIPIPAFDIHVSKKKKDKNNQAKVLLTYFGATYSPVGLNVNFGLNRAQALQLANKLLEAALKLEN
jgi:hypothetical protein